MKGRGTMAVAQMPGCDTYRIGGFWPSAGGSADDWGGERKRDTKGLVDGRWAVSARTSVSRLDDSYASGEWRPCTSAGDKVLA